MAKQGTTKHLHVIGQSFDIPPGCPIHVFHTDTAGDHLMQASKAWAEYDVTKYFYHRQCALEHLLLSVVEG